MEYAMLHTKEKICIYILSYEHLGKQNTAFFQTKAIASG